MLALVLAACDGHVGHVELVSGPARPCNVRVTAPLQLDRASIAVDGTQTNLLIANDSVPELLRRFFGARKRMPVRGFCYVPAGTHTIRLVQPGFEPIERVVTVSDPKTCLTEVEISAEDVKPVSR
jgi:hypothetical protein